MTTESAAPTAVPVAPHQWRPKRFMVIAAHPDDADFGPAATAACWIDAGSVGWLVCCTSGDQGGEDADLDPFVLAATREAEQRAAARIVGYEGVSFLHQPDGALENTLALREQLVREIRTFRPDAILCQDPEVLFHGRGGMNHTDHRAAGAAAVDAIYPAARNPMTFPHLARAGLAPHRVRRIYLFWSNQSNVWIDVSATLDRKIRALHEHRSQLKNPAALDERLRRGAAETGVAIGVPAADALRLVVIDDDEDEGPGETGAETAATAATRPETAPAANA